MWKMWYVKNESDNLYETLSKFTIGKNNLNMILSNQRVSYNKTILNGHAKKKVNHHIYKCNFVISMVILNLIGFYECMI